ncbi:hypothetical protein QJS66_12565 [Kocuria rhizophila]|nr:hypothetical protein QJS66_12565 [Kocuria rhizophila]
MRACSARPRTLPVAVPPPFPARPLRPIRRSAGAAQGDAGTRPRPRRWRVIRGGGEGTAQLAMRRRGNPRERAGRCRVPGGSCAMAGCRGLPRCRCSAPRSATSRETR